MKCIMFLINCEKISFQTILSPQCTFYNNLGQECVKAGCSVDLFLFNNAYIDIATLGQVCRLTGGQLYKYTYFQVIIRICFSFEFIVLKNIYRESSNFVSCL